MFVPNSNKQLRETLVRLNLCSERDFRRLRGRVRRLARGLPTFDFLWIDALLQAGALTPYQAKVLESSAPESLAVGPCILLAQIGRGEHCETFLARTRDASDRAVLKRLRPPAETFARGRERLRNYIDRLIGLETPYLVVPHTLTEHEGAIIAISRHIEGLDCRELLVRRGRFPADVVTEIARGLAQALAALESRGCLHGEIRLPNVRLTASGQAVLVDAGIRAALEPELLIRADIRPDRYDGTAPERIGTGNNLTTATDLYALGCLLWQLIAGRAPFPTGDPLGKLALHQSRAIPDVREWAPDTPAPLAEAIRTLTHLDPEKRPATFAEVAARFGSPSRQGERRLGRFRRLFDTAAPREAASLEQESRFPLATVALLVFVLAGAALTLVDSGAKSRVLRLGSDVSILFSRTRDNRNAADRAAPRASGENLLTLPIPNAEGLISLEDGPYEAETINVVGDLTIQGKSKVPARIVVGDRPLKILCRKLAIENVVIERRASFPSRSKTLIESATGLTPLADICSQSFALVRCAFLDDANDARISVGGTNRANVPSESRPAAVRWKTAAAHNPEAGRARLTNSLFDNAGAALEFATPPTYLETDNCLKIGGVFYDLGERSTARELVVRAKRVTLRQAGGLLRGGQGRSGNRAAPLRVILEECAFDLAGADAALVHLVSNSPVGRSANVALSGNESVIRPNVPILAWSKPQASSVTSIDLGGALVEGLAVGEFQFEGSATADPHDSAVQRGSCQIPRRSNEPPGIVAAALPSVSFAATLHAQVDSSREASRR